MSSQLNLHGVSDIKIKTDEFNWGNTITIEVTSRGVENEIVLYQDKGMDLIKLEAMKGQVMRFNTAQEVRSYLKSDNDTWYGVVLEGILETYQDDMSIEEIDELIKEEVKDLQKGYEDFNNDGKE